MVENNRIRFWSLGWKDGAARWTDLGERKLWLIVSSRIGRSLRADHEILVTRSIKAYMMYTKTPKGQKNRVRGTLKTVTPPYLELTTAQGPTWTKSDQLLRPWPIPTEKKKHEWLFNS